MGLHGLLQGQIYLLQYNDIKHTFILGFILLILNYSVLERSGSGVSSFVILSLAGRNQKPQDTALTGM
jgi:hypothetical protein